MPKKQSAKLPPQGKGLPAKVHRVEPSPKRRPGNFVQLEAHALDLPATRGSSDGSSFNPKRRYWLVKSEPESFSIADLARAKHQTTYWDGVRNYQARNTLRDLMKIDDQVLFYHSNANPPAIVGIARVVREGYPDHTALDPNDEHFDPKSTREKPTWYMVDLQFVQQFAKPLTLPMLKEVAELQNMELLRRGSRLSVQPVREAEFQTVLELALRQKDNL